MTGRVRRFFGRPALLLATLALLCACSTKYLHSEYVPDTEMPRPLKIAVLPLTVTEGGRDAEPFHGGAIPPGAESTVTDLLYQALEQQERFELVDRPVVDQAMARRPDPLASPGGLQQLARAAGAHAVIRGALTEYRERDGSHVGVERPAAVGIELWLVRARDGETIWHGRYYEAQKSMTEDIRTVPLYFKRGTRWLTAQELAAWAVGELVKTIPGAP